MSPISSLWNWLSPSRSLSTADHDGDADAHTPFLAHRSGGHPNYRSLPESPDGDRSTAVPSEAASVASETQTVPLQDAVRIIGRLRPENTPFPVSRRNSSLTSATSLVPSTAAGEDSVGEAMLAIPTEINYHHEVKVLAKLSYPVVLAYLLQYSINVASVFSLGHLGPNALAASALATMFASVTGWAFGIGLITALDTLCSQSFTGARDIHAVGTYLQRGIVAITICHVPIVIFWWYSESMLLALNQDPEIAHLAGLYLRYLIIGCLPNLLFECVKRYLQAQEIMHASTIVLCIVSPINILANYALVWWKPVALGFIGAPIATSICYWLMFILLVLYTTFVDGYQAWGGWSRASFQNIDQFMQLGLPGVVMICAEWWAFELVALAASYLGNIPLAAQSVVFTTVTLAFQIPEGISVACTNRVGNLLGAALPEAARSASIVAVVFSAGVGILNSLFFLLVGNWWGWLFTDEPEVVVLVSSLMKMAALFQIFDCISTVLAGILRGQGRQKLGALLSFPAHYIIGIPLGLYLSFTRGMGIIGLWIGLCAGITTICLSQYYFYARSDWVHEVEKCRKRVGLEGGDYDEYP